MQTVRYTSQKLIISGNIFELKTYSTRMRIDPLPQSKKRRPVIEGRSGKERREESSLYRSKQELRRLINANVGFHLKPDESPYIPLFITFTFRENMTDLKRANYIFTKFIQRFNHSLFGIKKSILKYIVAIEFQKRGAVHYHAIFFNIPYRRGLKQLVFNLWGEGFVKVESIKKHINDVGNYLTKYMTKEQFDSRLVGKKCYFSSRNIFRPVLVEEQEKVTIIMHFVKPEQKVFERFVDATAYSPEYLYQKYNVNNPGFVRGALDLIAKGRYPNPKL